MASIKRCKSTKKFEAFQVESSIVKQTWGIKSCDRQEVLGASDHFLLLMMMCRILCLVFTLVSQRWNYCCWAVVPSSDRLPALCSIQVGWRCKRIQAHLGHRALHWVSDISQQPRWEDSASGRQWNWACSLWPRLLLAPLHTNHWTGRPWYHALHHLQKYWTRGDTHWVRTWCLNCHLKFAICCTVESFWKSCHWASNPLGCAGGRLWKTNQWLPRWLGSSSWTQLECLKTPRCEPHTYYRQWLKGMDLLCQVEHLKQRIGINIIVD